MDAQPAPLQPVPAPSQAAANLPHLQTAKPCTSARFWKEETLPLGFRVSSPAKNLALSFLLWSPFTPPLTTLPGTTGTLALDEMQETLRAEAAWGKLVRNRETEWQSWYKAE